MKQKLIVFATAFIFLSSLSFSIFAQDGTMKKSSAYRANEMWYVSVGAGPNILMCSQDGEMPSFGDRIKYGGELSVGKWITPIWGIRAQVYQGKYTGFNFTSPQYGTFTWGDRTHFFPKGWPDKLEYTSDGSGFYQRFTSTSALVDVTLNFSNLFSKEVKPRHFDFIGFLGAGYFHNGETETNPTVNCFGERFGGRVNYNVVKGGHFSIYLEGDGTYLPDKYDGYIGDKGYDSNANVLIGVQYTFK